MVRKKQPKKYVFVTGGVVSSLGKGIAASGLGTLLEARGLRVGFLKLDPYVNVDPGLMDPTQHGEVYVTDDGAQTDLDLGHYERFTTASMSRKNSYTSGQIYLSVIQKERQGAYNGGTVQVVPHITDEIKRTIHAAAEDCDILFTEIGGTVGDIEGMPFLEAIRQMRIEVGDDHIFYVHVTLVPWIAAAGELKTKPTQHSVRELRAIGIQPDMLLCRSDRTIDPDVKGKLARSCNIEISSVISVPDASSIYEVPLLLNAEGADEVLLQGLGIWTGGPRLKEWKKLVERVLNPMGSVRIAIVGKYVELTDAYKSLSEALQHGGYHHRVRVELDFVGAKVIEEEGAEARLAGADAILVPGGFGAEGINGKLLAIRYARENEIPFFGLCLGMQLTVIEYARNIASIPDAQSREFVEDSEHAVIDWRVGEDGKVDKSMRLGAKRVNLEPGSRVATIYGESAVMERHRHRFELATAYCEPLEAAGLKLSGRSADQGQVEVVELPDHPWFLAVQYHPEFRSRPTEPHPVFVSYVEAAMKHAARRAEDARAGEA